MSVTLIVVAPSMTWLLVRISPEEVSTIPVPAASSCWNPSVVLMSTNPGSTLFAIAETSPEPEDPDDPDDPEPTEPEPDPNGLADPEPFDDGILPEEEEAEAGPE